MRRFGLALPLAVLAVSAPASVSQGSHVGQASQVSQVSQGAHVTSLHALRDVARPLLIFAAKPDAADLAIQLRTLEEHAAEAHDRDLVAIALPFRNPSPTPVQLSSAEAEALRRRFGIAPEDFAVILLGKDGGAKLRSAKPLSMRRLAETIDAMPMRQEEMRSKTPTPTH